VSLPGRLLGAQRPEPPNASRPSGDATSRKATCGRRRGPLLGAPPPRAARGFRPKRQTRFRAKGAKTALLFGSPRNPLSACYPAVRHVAEVQQQLHLATKQEGKENPMIPHNSIIQGDCVTGMRNLPPASVDFVLTDPPYLVDYRSRDGRKVANDRNADWLRPAFSQIYRVMKPASFCVSFYGWSWNRVHLFMAAWRDAGFRAVGHIVFRKRYASSARFFRAEHEVAYLPAKGDMRPPARPIPDVIEFRYTGNKLHPTQKPVAALAPLIDVFCPQNGVVLDPFAGSGSSLVAARQLGRRFIGFEIDEQHHRTATARLEEMKAAA
jgi:adenine-specific DNA-methyltransferase